MGREYAPSAPVVARQRHLAVGLSPSRDRRNTVGDVMDLAIVLWVGRLVALRRYRDHAKREGWPDRALHYQARMEADVWGGPYGPDYAGPSDFRPAVIDS